MPEYDSILFDPPAPVARVSLRNMKSGAIVHNVAMLIDSGADVTLIPSLVARTLEVEPEADKRYELAGFDNSRSLATVVKMELVFLEKTFRGQFLLIEQDWGIIGRNILNSLSLLLDGPGLQWTKSPG